MRRASSVFLFLLAVPVCQAAEPLAGRWTGRAHLPGRDLNLVVDLAQDPAGAWIGSIVIPGFDVKGAALGDIRVGAGEISFDIGNVLGASPDGPAAFAARIAADGAMAGEMRQGGNAAPFELKRTGSAQVDPPRKSTVVPRAIEGRWVGDYELGGYARHVTLDIANAKGAPATVEFVVVGKATTKLPIDFVAEEEGLVRIECNAYRIAFEGRIRADRIDGTLEQAGLFEVPLVLRRAS